MQPLSLRRGFKHSMLGFKLRKAYSGLIPISELKYNDLQNLCKKRIIPEMYHSFYNDLPHNGQITDRLNEPDENDDSDME